jgi:mRNA interferase RelE/StbE
LDGSVKEPLRKLLKKRLDNPHVPGAALHGELQGYYKIKLRQQGYRLVYGVEDDVLIVVNGCHEALFSGCEGAVLEFEP